jgi:nitroreductase
MDVKDAIAKRLSIRRYARAFIPEDHMEILFQSLQLAASGNNNQNWEFVFVGDADMKSQLVGACANQSFIANCAYFIAGIADPSQKWHMVDITIAFTNFTLQAAELGYGTCWIGAFDESKIKYLLDVPDGKKVVICMTFGAPEGRHVARNRKATDEFVFSERYGRPWSDDT